MLSKEYNRLIDYIESMISEEVKLIHGGHIVDWNDTKIPGLIAKIKEKNESVITPNLNPGDHLKSKISGQDMWVINNDSKTVFLALSLSEPTLKYPLDKILKDFYIIKRAQRNQKI